MDATLPIRRNSKQGYTHLMQELFSAEARQPGKFFILSPWIDTTLLCKFIEGNIAHSDAFECSEVHVLTRQASLARLDSDTLPAHAGYGVLGYSCNDFHYKVYAKEIQPGVVRFADTSANFTSAHLDEHDYTRNADTWKTYTCPLEVFLKTYWWPQRPRAPKVCCFAGCTLDMLAQYSVVVDDACQRTLLYNATVLHGDARRTAAEILLKQGVPNHADSRLEALCTGVGLLSFPRASSSSELRVDDEDTPQRARQSDDTSQPSLQPRLRLLVAQLLNTFEAGDRARRMPAVYETLNIILDRKDSDAIACPEQWGAIAIAIGRREKHAPLVASKRRHGLDSESSSQSRAVFRNAGALAEPGAWRRCKRCELGRYIVDSDSDRANRQCWNHDCEFSTTAKSWRACPEPCAEDAARWRDLALRQS